MYLYCLLFIYNCNTTLCCGSPFLLQGSCDVQCYFVCNSMMACWFFVKFLWEVQSLDNSVSQTFNKDEASCSRDIQVRHKSILVSNTKLFLHNSMLNQNGLYSTLSKIITKINNSKKCFRRYNSPLGIW